MSDPELHRCIADALDEEGAVDLLRRAVFIPSVTGTEAAFGAFVAEALRGLGLDEVRIEPVVGERPIVWGVRRGTGGGPRLLLTGHLDTVHARGWAERWAGDPRQDPFGGAVVEGAMWGRGVGDLKAGICAALSALRTLDRAGVRLAGDVVFLFVSDEESGEAGSGVSAGMKAALPHLRSGAIPRPDFAVYVEPTRLEVLTAQIGFFIAEITLYGRSAYFGTPELGADALKAAHRVLAALWDHAASCEAAGDDPLVGKSSLLVTAIGGGGLIAVPETCRLSLIRKLRPGEPLGAAASALEEVVRGAVGDPEVSVRIDYPAGRDHAVGGEAFATDPELDPVRRLRAAAGLAAPGRGGTVAGAPFWSEASFLTALGIPAVYFAPGDIRNCHTLEERVELREYRQGIEALALFMADYCGHSLTG